MHKLFYCSILLFFGTGLFAQAPSADSVVITGVVSDCRYGFPLSGVEVTLNYYKTKVYNTYKTKTDKNGQYSFRLLGEKATIEIKLSAEGVTSEKAPRGYSLVPEKSKAKFFIDTVKQNKINKVDLCLSSIGLCRGLMPTILFSKNKAVIEGGMADSVSYLFNIFRDNPSFVFEIIGHASIDEKNPSALSLQRAKVIREYMISKGVLSDRIKIKGEGTKIPYEELYADGSDYIVYNKEYIASLKTIEEQETAHRKNRRITFQIISRDYKDK